MVIGEMVCQTAEGANKAPSAMGTREADVLHGEGLIRSNAQLVGLHHARALDTVSVRVGSWEDKESAAFVLLGGVVFERAHGVELAFTGGAEEDDGLLSVFRR